MTYSKTCAWCGLEFTTTNPKGRFCTKLCRDRDWNKKLKLRRAAAPKAGKRPGSKTPEQRDAEHYYERTYRKIKNARRSRPPVQSGWRGTPCMGGGAIEWTMLTPRLR